MTDANYAHELETVYCSNTIDEVRLDKIRRNETTLGTVK